MTFAPASAAPIAAPRPAGPPPTTSTSVSPASAAWRGGSAMRASCSGRLNEGTACFFLGEKFQKDLVRLLRARLQRRHRLREHRAHGFTPVPGLVEVRDEAPGVHE